MLIKIKDCGIFMGKESFRENMLPSIRMVQELSYF